MNDIFLNGAGAYVGTLALAIGVGIMSNMENRASRIGMTVVSLSVVLLYFVGGFNAPLAIPLFLIVANGIDLVKSLYEYRDSPLLEGESPMRKILISISHPARVREAAMQSRQVGSS